MIESGVPGFETTIWYGVFVLAGVPKTIIAKLNADVLKAIQAPDVNARLAQLAADGVSSSPEQLVVLQRSEIAKWGKIVKQAGVTAE